MKKFRWLAPMASVLVVMAGCGGTTKTTVTVQTPLQAQTNQATAAPPPVSTQAEHGLCPPENSYMGCSVIPQPQPPMLNRRNLTATLWAGPRFPDVSVWQGHVNWGAVAAWQRSHGWPTGGIFKMGEGLHRDSQAQNNATGTMQLQWRGGYWFTRNVGCKSEADAIISASRTYKIRVVWIDAEVSEARGYGVCLTPRLRDAGLIPGEYTAPGTNPGGLDTSDPLWQATYGSSFRAIWQPVVAWQCSDGQFGCVTNIPGIGRDDVSIDLGISKIGATPPKPPDPFAIMDHTVRHFANGQHAREYNTARTWKLRGCQTPVHRPVCVSTRAHLILLSDRLWTVAHRTNPPSWQINNRGLRFKIMRDDLK